MNKKLDSYEPKQVAIDMFNRESWLKVKQGKDLSCSYCDKSYTGEYSGDISLATFKGKPNAHMCRDCGLLFIEKGAVDVNKNKERMKSRKEKLIKQAYRVSKTRWYKKNEELSVAELEKRIEKAIDDEREQFHRFLKYPYIDILKSFTDELRKEKHYEDISYFEVFKQCPDLLWDYDTDDHYDHHKWISYFSATKKVGDKVFEYTWANANGDMSIEDQGFCVEDVWETMVELNPTDTVTDSQVLNYLIDEVIAPDNKDEFLGWVKDKIVENGE